MHRVYVAGASATPPDIPESMPNPNHYPSQDAIFDPYTAYAWSEELANIATANGAALDPESTNQCITAIQALIAAAGIGAPTGSILDFAGTTAPTGFLLCDGSAVSRTTYAALYAVIGTTFGAGNGTTTFNVPDLRGRFKLGKDNMGGVSANRVTSAQADALGGSEGEEGHALTASEMAHNHSIPSNGTLGDPSSLNYRLTGQTTGAVQNVTATAHNNMPPYLTVNCIIKT